MKKIVLKIWTITARVIPMVMLVVIPMVVMAQPPEPEGDPDVPIDGGVTLLVAAGVGYGVKKLRDRKAKQLNK